MMLKLQLPELRRLLWPAGRLGLGSLLGQCCFLLLAPALTRVYEPVHFGVFAIFLTVTSIDVVAALGFDRAIYRPPSEADAARLAVLGATSSAILSILVVIPGVYFLQKLPYLPIEFAQLPSLSWLAGICVLAFGLGQVATAVSLRSQRFDLVAISKTLQLPIMAISQLVLALAGAGATGLVYGHVIGQCLITMFLIGPLWRSVRRSEIQLHTLVEVAQQFSAFPRFVLLGPGLNSVSLQLPAAIIGATYGAAFAGYYGFTARIVGGPMGLLTQSIGNAFLGIASQSARNQQTKELRRVIVMTMCVQLTLLLPFIVATIAAPTIFARALGAEWRVAGELMQLMAPMLITQFLITPFHGLIDICGRPELHAKREVARAVLLLCGFAAMLASEASEQMAVLLLSAAIGGGYVVGGVQLCRLYRDIESSTQTR